MSLHELHTIATLRKIFIKEEIFMKRQFFIFLVVFVSISIFSCKSTPTPNTNSSNSIIFLDEPVIVETQEWLDPESVVGTTWIAEVDMGPFMGQRVYEFFDGFVEFSQRMGNAVDKSNEPNSWHVEGTVIIITSPDGGVNRAIVKDYYFYFENEPDLLYYLSF